MENRFGNFDVGKEADFVVVDPAGTPALHANVTQAVRSADPGSGQGSNAFRPVDGHPRVVDRRGVRAGPTGDDGVGGSDHER